MPPSDCDWSDFLRKLDILVWEQDKPVWPMRLWARVTGRAKAVDAATALTFRVRVKAAV